MKGKWKNIYGSLLTEKAYGTCSICHKKSELKTEAYFLSLDVMGLDKCPNCNNNMEFYYNNFEEKTERNKMK